MKTVYKWQKKSIINSLFNGDVVAFPTDTVFGLGCIIHDERAYDKILAIKGRDPRKLISILISNPKQVEMFAEVNQQSLELIHKHWPGSLTIVMKKKSIFSHGHFKDSDGIGFRMPNNKWLLSIIDKTGPLFVTSANISGKLALENWKDIAEELPHVDLIVRDHMISEPPSTVVSTQNRILKIIRKGAIDI